MKWKIITKNHLDILKQKVFSHVKGPVPSCIVKSVQICANILVFTAKSVCEGYLVIELTEAALQVERARVGEFGEYLQMGNQLSVRKRYFPHYFHSQALNTFADNTYILSLK